MGRTYIALMLSIAVWGAACDAQPGAGPTTTPPTTQGPTPNGPDAAWALWPEDTREAAIEAARDPARSEEGLEAVGLRFADEVLGWPNAIHEEYEGPVDCGELECLAIHREVGGPRLLLRFVSRNDTHGASVFGVGPVDGTEIPLGLSVQGSSVTAVFDLGFAESAELRIGYGGREATHTYTETSEDAFDLGFEPDASGHYLLLFMGGDGRVFGALGSALPEGDFAAG